MDADLPIKGFLDTSFLDWPGRLAAVIFLGGCNFRCPFCHNPELVLFPEALPTTSPGEVLAQLEALRGWVDGVVVTGGEPTLQPRLPELLGRLRSAGLAVKLDTNGSRPEVLARLLASGRVQAVDMDVKAPLEDEAYSRLAGVPVRAAEIRASVEILRFSGVAHRFRTTQVPVLLAAEEMELLRAQLPPGSAHVVQEFRARRTLDPALIGTPAAPALAGLRGRRPPLSPV